MEYDVSKNKIEGWMNKADLLWLFRIAKEMESVVEIGSWKGRSTHALLLGCKGIVYAVDHFLGDTGIQMDVSAKSELKNAYTDFVKNVGDFKNLKIFKMDNAEAVKHFEDNSIDLIFIDGDHSYEAVLADIKRWLPKAKKIICGHDRRNKEVRKAVKKMFGDNFERNEARGSLWIKRIQPSKESLKINSPTAGIVYYTDNQLDEKIMKRCQEYIKKSALPIVSVSLQPIDFGDNIVLPLQRSRIAMFKQILIGLEKLDTDVAFLCEHDVLYHPSHFDFRPPKKDVYYYNMNTWQLRASDGHAVYFDAKRLSQICADRQFLVEHYRKKVALAEKNNSEWYARKMGYEPGTHNRRERVDDFKAEEWRSEFPSVDIRHEKNLTRSRWSKAEFRHQNHCENWKEADEIPGWSSQQLNFS